MSPALLSQRLRELEDAGVVERRQGEGRGSEYHLTQAGMELKPIIESLGLWGSRWARSQLHHGDYDAGLLMWDIRRNIDLAALPEGRRMVVQFDLSGVVAKMRRWWLVIHDGEVDLCLKDPGHEVDLYLSSDIRTLTAVWMGHLPISEAIRSGNLAIEGLRRLAASFRKSLKLSVFANA